MIIDFKKEINIQLNIIKTENAGCGKKHFVKNFKRSKLKIL